MPVAAIEKPVESKSKAASFAPQAIKISSKRQITIPSKLFKEKGFTDYAWIEETEDGFFIRPVEVQDEDVSLSILRELVAEGYEGEELIAQYEERLFEEKIVRVVQQGRKDLEEGRVIFGIDAAKVEVREMCNKEGIVS